MNKTTITSILAWCLLVTTVHIMQSSTSKSSPSFWQVAVNLMFGTSTPEQTSSHLNPLSTTITAQDYANQLRVDLNGPVLSNKLPLIPWSEVDEIELALKEELRTVDVRNSDHVNQIIRSILINHVKTKTVKDLNELQREGFVITAHDYHAIPESHEYNMLARLNRMPHINGEAIAQYFGQQRKNSTRQSVLNRSKNFNPFDSSGRAYH